MSTKIGSIIDGGDGGESGTLPDIRLDPGPTNSNGGDIKQAPGDYFDLGTDAKPEPPRTVRIDSGDAGAGDTRYTKDGRIDGRTRAGRAFRGSASGTSEAQNRQILGDKLSLKELLISLHLALAAFTDTQELMLEESEAKRLADAMAEVSKYYTMVFDPKKVAIANLLIVAGGIYGPRFMAWKINRDKTSKPPKPGEPVIPIDQKTNMKDGLKNKSNGAPAMPSDFWPEPGVISEFGF